jgi:phage shock protein E
MNKFSFLFLLLVSMLLFTACSGQQKVPDYAEAILVDVRTPEEFASGTVNGAINIPVDELESQLTKLNKDAEIVVFCRSGSRSARAAAILEKNGFKHVFNGGTWQQVNSKVLTMEKK